MVDYAYINNISNYKDCSCDGNLPSNGGGKILLKFVINYLIQNKNIFKFKINKIVLQDNSYITCKKINIPLSDLYFLTHGDTWYGQFNFRPFYSLNNIPDKNNIKLYENYKNIINQIKLKDYIKIYDLIIKVDKKLNINHIDENKLKKIILKNENMLLKDFLNKLLKDKYPMCLIFNEIKTKIMSYLNIKSFHTNSFYLNI